MLSRSQKRLRLATTLLVAAGLLVGTFLGNDDNFPFGPFRMYSTSTRDKVAVLVFEGVTVNGEQIDIPSARFGLRRAELDGQRRRLGTEPDLMAGIAESYHRFNPDEPRLKQLLMLQEIYQLDESGKPVLFERVLVAGWPDY
jgi:hypothetical protein